MKRLLTIFCSLIIFASSLVLPAGQAQAATTAYNENYLRQVLASLIWYSHYLQQQLEAVQSVSATVVANEADRGNYEHDEAYLEKTAKEIHRLTNRERTRAELPALSYDPPLQGIAMKHSEDMLKKDYFDHTSPKGCDMACRMDAVDYLYGYWGENIAWRRSGGLPSAHQLAEHFVEAWMDSPGHRHNILSKNLTHEGVGLAREGNLVYVTASFVKP